MFDPWQRVIAPELLDGAGGPLVRKNLEDIAWINRWLGGQRVVRRILSCLVSPSEKFSVLDVGAASGDIGACLRRVYPGAVVVSLDHSVNRLDRAAAPKLAADAFHLPFRPGSFDFVLCCLFLHHFEDAEVSRLLRTFLAISRRAVVAVDLERHWLAYHFLPATRWFLRWSELTLQDGPVSVQASFTPEELAVLAGSAGLDRATIRSHSPWFRLSMVARR